MIFLEHEHGTTTFTIEGVADSGDGLFTVQLKWSPHLLENMLSVVAISGRELTVEPPPSMSSSYGRLHYQVYRVESDGQASHVAQVEQARGPTMEVDRVPQDLSVGGLIGLTRMRRSRDRFRIPGSVTVMKGQVQPAG